MTWMDQYCHAVQSLRFSNELEQSIVQGIERGIPEDAIRIRRQNRKKHMRWAMTTAACAVILFAVWSISPLLHRSGNELGTTPEPSGFIGQRAVIDGRGMDDNSASSCYASPAPGTWFCTPSVRQAMQEHAGENVLYCLTFDVLDQDGFVSIAQIYAELERLAGLGYQVGYIKTSASENMYGASKLPAGYFTQEQIQSFQPNPQYGYFFHFIPNEGIVAIDASNPE